MANILDLPRDQFLASLNELAAQGVNTDDLRRQYRQKNSFFAPLFDWASGSEQAIADQGRTTAGMGLLSKEAGTTGMDALRSVQFEPSNFVAGLLAGGAKAADAPAAAAQGLIPAADMPMEALNVAGTAQLGGAASMGRGIVDYDPNTARIFAGQNSRTADLDALALPAARNEAEAMARNILEMRAAGRAGDVTEEMRAAADPMYMYQNTPLPMDEASRMARAGAAGFDTELPLYHGTGADFQRFDPARFQQSDFGTGGAGVYSSESPDLASAYADLVTRPSNDNANILPIVARRQEAYDTGGYRNINNYEQAREYSRRMQDLGFDNVYYRDNMSGEIVENVTFDPQNIRSRFALFDPEFSHLANLNAANASPLAGILAMPNEEERNRQLGLLFGGY